MPEPARSIEMMETRSSKLLGFLRVVWLPPRDADLFHKTRELCPFDHVGRGRPGNGLIFEEVCVVHGFDFGFASGYFITQTYC